MPTATAPAPMKFRFNPAMITDAAKNSVTGEGTIAHYKGKQVGIIRPCVVTTSTGVCPGYRVVNEDGDVITVWERDLAEPFIPRSEFSWNRELREDKR